MARVRYHDRYGTNEFADKDKPYWREGGSGFATFSSSGRSEAGASGAA